MSHSLKPAARLAVIFILAIVLSGSVLAYFSINNISNLKELTEKKILEEQRVLSDRVLNAINVMLINVTAGLSDNNSPLAELRQKLLTKDREFAFVTQSFIIGDRGQFIHPNFSKTLPPSPDIQSFVMSVSSFTTGEIAEFAEQDLRKARSHYQSGLKYASESSDTARALNALGRVAVKMTDYENAIAHYSLIITDHSDVTDANGLPYSCYALQQLLRIADQNNFSKTLPAVRLCLEKMANGTISLFYSTEELLELIPDYLKKIGSDKPDDTAVIDSLLASLREQTRFINMYGEELIDLVIKENAEKHPVAFNDFILADPSSGLTKDYVLIYASHENKPGFLIDSERLLDNILIKDLHSGLEFDYIIDFPASFTQTDVTSDRLIYTSQLNPFFPGQTMAIKPGDETLINDIVRRRAWIYGIAFLLLLGAMLLGVILILMDIAREKHLARLRSDFISNVTHELKTPLTSIRMYAESLMMGRVKSDSVQTEYLSVVVNEADRLKRMINNILEFSKMEKGIPEYHLVNSNLALILNEAIHEMNYWFEKEQFEVVTELDENICAEVDPEKMKQAVGNLLSNAIKYSTDTKKIFVRLFNKPEHICIEVEDLGVGIPEDKLSRILEQFYRIEQKESISGTGLGLTVVKEIIEAHNGTITVTSEIGKGSRFTIRMPLDGN